VAADALLRSLRHVWLLLEERGVPTALLGGLALATWKHVRATRDIDLLVGVGQDEVEDLLAYLGAAGIRPKRSPAITPLGELAVIQLLYEPEEAFLDLQIDLLLATSEYHQEALRRRIPTQLPELDVPLAVLTCEDLILHKLLAGRLIDRVDAATLLRANRPALDVKYLTDWAHRLGVEDEFVAVCREVFPGQPTDTGPGSP